jgi:hypothetical protein
LPPLPGISQTQSDGVADNFSEIYRVSFAKPVNAIAWGQIHGESNRIDAGRAGGPM